MSSNDNDNINKREEKGGEASANKTTFAAPIAKILKGIDSPADKNNLVKHAQQNKENTKILKPLLIPLIKYPKKNIILWQMHNMR
jgi:hypothetical protein